MANGTIEPTVEEVAWSKLRRALQEHRDLFLKESGKLTLELQFHNGRMMGVETRVIASERFAKPPALT